MVSLTDQIFDLLNLVTRYVNEVEHLPCNTMFELFDVHECPVQDGG